MTPLKIGAALCIEAIPTHRDWLYDADRDLEIQDFIFYDTYRNGWKDTVDRARAATDGFRGRLGIHGPFIGLAIDNPDPDVREITAQRYVSAVEAAAALGARQMVIHSPFDLWTHHHKLTGDGRQHGIFEAAHTLLRPALELAEAHGVLLVVENCRDVVPSDRRDMIEASGSLALAVSIDTGHAHLARDTYGAPPGDFFVRDAGDLLKHVHLQDLDGYADRHWAPGEGRVPWIELFRALGELDSAPHLVLELRRHDDIPKGFAHLQSLGIAV